MFAVEWLRYPGALPDAARLAASLAAGQRGSPASEPTARAAFAAFLPQTDPRRARSWKPTRVGPLAVLFHGHLDNTADAARALGLPAPACGDNQALAALYGQALLTWGEDTDLRLIGEYAAATLDETRSRLRLARSPLRAPPLHYHAAPGRVIAATAVRAIFAGGVGQRLNESRLADMALFNASDEQRGWFEEVSRVPLGSVVLLTPDGEDTRRYYDIDALPMLDRAAPQDYLAQAQALLAKGTRAALAGSKRPGLMLSGGLDSALVAVNTLDALPAAEPLNAYTFVVEPGWSGRSLTGQYGDERPRVEALCAMHPRILPHFHDNAERGYDPRLDQLFMAIGGAQQGLANLGVYHRLWEAAREDGCDRVLLGEFGNATLSASGDWAFREYLLQGRWHELYLALRDAPADNRPLWRKLASLALLPLLPDPLWRWQRRLRGIPDIYLEASPLRRDYAEASGALARSRAAGLPDPRHPVRDRRALLREVHANAWGEFSDIYSGFEQVHGIAQRDPTAYRPLFEFCAGLPSTMFLRGGQQRWLARALLRGRIPEDQRLSALRGSHNADWHSRLSRQRGAMLEQLERLKEVPRLAAMFDFERLRHALENWPETDAVGDAERLAISAALPRALIMARFVNYVEGRNEG